MFYSRSVVAAAWCCLLAAPAFADKLDDDLAAAKALLIAGDADGASDKLDALEAAARQAAAAKPDDAHAHYILGMAAMYAGGDATATRSLDLAMRLDPKNPRYVFGRAELASYQNRQVEAANLLQRFLQQNPQNVEGWELLGVAQSEARQYPQARESFQKASDLAPKEPKYVARIAEILVAQGKDDEAIVLYEKALLIDPKYAIGLSSLGDLYLRQKKNDKALPLFEQAVAANPLDYRSLARQIQIHQATGNVKERDAALDRIRALHAGKKVEFAAFCREQIARDTGTVMAFEYFPVPGADSATVYAFVVLGADGREIAQRLQVAVTGANTGRPLFQLVSDTDRVRSVITSFPAKPSYEEVRRAAVDFLDKTPPSPAAAPARGG
jgi:cytochrome c-type biogenesis protein CcmH/NrfG